MKVLTYPHSELTCPRKLWDRSQEKCYFIMGFDLREPWTDYQELD